MTYTAVDCQGFAGAFTLGMVQAGFELIGKREMRGGFGVRNCEANRHLLGERWQTEACAPTEWSAPHASVVFGNPPCSGFSVLSTKSFRGPDSKINACMWAFVEYAARVKPEVAVFESVPLAFTQGRGLMTALRGRLEELTGERWTLHHVLHNAYSVGGPAMRKRYFWVAARVPFGIERPVTPRLPTLLDVIGDLQSLPTSWESQPYTEQPTWYSGRLSSPSGTLDGHASADNPHMRRTLDIIELLRQFDDDWRPGEAAQSACRRLYERTGGLPPSWGHVLDKLIKNDFFQGFNTPVRWRGDQWARVITGAGPMNVLHPVLDRFITFREVARILGFPDNWLIEPLRGTPSHAITWGKGITVDCGRWIGTWISRALDGEAGTYVGDEVGERELLIDVTNDWNARSRVKYSTVKTAEKHNKEKTVTEAVETVEAESAGRGRPRPSDTIERDERVFAALDAPKTREALAAELELEPKQAYLSLWRLRKNGRITRTREGGAHVWTRVEG